MKRSVLRWLNIAATATVLVPLFLVASLWSFSYFWTDDFGNAFWIQSLSGTEIVGHVANPLSTYYRPLGLLFYWGLYHSFGLNPVPYHLVAWLLHGINTLLLFLILRRLLRSPFAAVAGVIPFAFRVNFSDMYWSFGTIFELLACGLMMAGLYIYIRSRRSLVVMLILCAVYFLALKSKEMAITLPVVWLLYDAIVSRDLVTKPAKVAVRLALPALILAWFTFLRMGTMCEGDPAGLYFMDLRFETVVSGFGQYFSWLYGVYLPGLVWSALILGAVIFAVVTRQRLALFFLGYTIVTFAPVILLPNHRWPYFWYIPFLGVSGLFALGALAISHWLRRQRLSGARLAVSHLVLLISLSTVNSALEYRRSSKTRAYEASLALVFETFVRTLGDLDPEQGATLYFAEMPAHFTPEVLNASVQLALHRPDLRARFVTEFPEGARWKLRVSNGEVHKLPGTDHQALNAPVPGKVGNAVDLEPDPPRKHSSCLSPRVLRILQAFTQ